MIQLLAQNKANRMEKTGEKNEEISISYNRNENVMLNIWLTFNVYWKFNYKFVANGIDSSVIW